MASPASTTPSSSSTSSSSSSTTSLQSQSEVPKYSFYSLLTAVKGCVEYAKKETFMLHVFWEVPSLEKAERLLEGLRQCAVATHRDTPCTPLYFFRIATNDTDLCEPPYQTVGSHPALKAARKKLTVGIPKPAVHADLKKKGLDPSLLDLDDSAPLPESIASQRAVRLEMTEVYLDEKGFMEHAGSRDYLDGYGIVMDPSLVRSPPITLRLGTPTKNIQENILEVILKETVHPLAPGCALFRVPDKNMTRPHVLFSIDFAAAEGVDASSRVAASLPTAIRDESTTCVTFVHPLRENTVRVLFVVSSPPSLDALTSLAALTPLRGEGWSPEADEATISSWRHALAEAGLSSIRLNHTPTSGYVLHARATELVAVESTKHVFTARP